MHHDCPAQILQVCLKMDSKDQEFPKSTDGHCRAYQTLPNQEKLVLLLGTIYSNWTFDCTDWKMNSPLLVYLYAAGDGVFGGGTAPRYSNDDMKQVHK